MTRRLFLAAVPLLAGAPPERLAGTWRARIGTFKSGRATYTRFRMLFAKNGAFSIEEFRNGGELDWVYTGTLDLSGSNELTLRATAVHDAAGQAAPEGRRRWEAGESYNLGVLDMESATRARVGGMELLKELQ
ncbi:MAG: hypothetical protein FJW30_03110 [Acidobacteria bacterium]|nr:hypothetical protein [Acidobacteriota bacterium]